MVCSQYPEENQDDVEEALNLVHDPFFIMSILSLLKFNLNVLSPPEKPFIPQTTFEWTEKIVYYFHFKYYEKSNYSKSTLFYQEQRELLEDSLFEVREIEEKYHAVRKSKESMEALVELYLKRKRLQVFSQEKQNETIWKIFSLKNSKEGIKYCCVDLHGLYYKETLIILDKVLPEIQ